MVASANATSVTAAPATLTFNAGNWNQPQTVTVTGVQDANMTSETVALTLSSAGLANVMVNVTANDDDVQRIQTSVNAVTVTEGMTGNFGVNLATAPLANVTVTLTTSDPAAATVAPATLTFTPANFNVQQNVVITGIEDADQNNETVTIMATSAGVDPVSVTVTIIDHVVD